MDVSDVREGVLFDFSNLSIRTLGHCMGHLILCSLIIQSILSSSEAVLQTLHLSSNFEVHYNSASTQIAARVNSSWPSPTIEHQMKASQND